VTFYYLAKVSNLGNFWGIFFGQMWELFFFLLYNCHNKKFVYSIWQTTIFHYLAKVLRLSTILQKSKTLSYVIQTGRAVYKLARTRSGVTAACLFLRRKGGKARGARKTVSTRRRSRTVEKTFSLKPRFQSRIAL
jgi:hypothetical protein